MYKNASMEYTADVFGSQATHLELREEQLQFSI